MLIITIGVKEPSKKELRHLGSSSVRFGSGFWFGSFFLGSVSFPSLIQPLTVAAAAVHVYVGCYTEAKVVT